VAVPEGEQAAVADRHAMRVTGEIAKHTLRPAEGRLCVDDPLLELPRFRGR
jgi:hypothetical protein